MTNEPTDIIETLEKLREKNYPELPADMVRKIVEAEYETLENRSQSRKNVSAIVEEHFEGE
jgi:hypothetical protein